MHAAACKLTINTSLGQGQRRAGGGPKQVKGGPAGCRKHALWHLA